MTDADDDDVCEAVRVFVLVRDAEDVCVGVDVDVLVRDGVCVGVADDVGHTGGSTTPRNCASVPSVAAGVVASVVAVFVAVFHLNTPEADVVVLTDTAYRMYTPAS